MSFSTKGGFVIGCMGDDDYYGSEINHGRLYPNLDTLVEKGLVDKSKKDDRTNEYTLTTRGHREIEARREWEEEYVGELG